jgi:hypothetical protein
MSSKKKIFIANENGDWWEYTPGEKLYVLDLNDPSPELQDWMACECDEEDHEEFVIDDSLIHNFGTEIPTPTKE